MTMPVDTSRVDPTQITAAIEAYQRVAVEVAQVASDVFYHGRLDEAWARDNVSEEMASHYNSIIFEGEFSTHSILLKYEQEISNTIRVLRQALAEYLRIEDENSALLS